MPRQSSKVSGVFSRYGPKAVEAFNKHKGDETEYGNFGDLPPGIDGGIALNAQLATLKESAPFFRFRTWQGPKSDQYPNPRVNHTWEGTQGLEDYTPPDEGSPVEDDATGPAAPSERLKGNGSATRPPVAPSSPPGRPTAASPTNTRPTSQEDRPSASTGQPDGKPVAPSARPTARPVTPPAGRPSGKPSSQPVAPLAAEPVGEFGDLDSLAEKADAEDKESQKSLEAMATEAGVSREAVKKARSWADVAALIAAGQPGDEEEEEVEVEDEGTEGTEEGSSDDSDDEEEDEWEGPVVGDMYSYRIGKKLADVEVLEVNAARQTVTVKNYSDPRGTQIKGVKWEQLIRKPPTE
jgi:hypothetical protein